MSLPEQMDANATAGEQSAPPALDGTSTRHAGHTAATSYTLNSQAIRNPKPNETGVAALYRYYAGFSSGFVSDVLSSLRLREGATILDPWNGGGTTTDGAARHGFGAVGVDINPAAVIIARARLATAADIAAARRTAALVLSCATKLRSQVVGNDLLCRWLGPQTATEFRRIERALAKLQGREDVPLERCAQMPAADALLYVALFHALRALLREARTTNPTWFRLDRLPRRVGARAGHVWALFQECAAEVLSKASMHAPSKTAPMAALLVGSSVELPLGNCSVDAVVTSPPYCTRIDYAIATLPELALLGFDEIGVRRLRDSMIGTPTVSGRVFDPPAEWGATCVNTLRRIAEHQSKGSLVYYYKVQLVYFSRLIESLRELDRVLAGNGFAVFVVQDSYYKEVHIDLRAILVEMTREFGWAMRHERHFDATHSMSDIHPGIARYRSISRPRESVLFFQRPDRADPHSTIPQRIVASQPSLLNDCNSSAATLNPEKKQ